MSIKIFIHIEMRGAVSSNVLRVVFTILRFKRIATSDFQSHEPYELKVSLLFVIFNFHILCYRVDLEVFFVMFYTLSHAGSYWSHDNDNVDFTICNNLCFKWWNI